MAVLGRRKWQMIAAMGLLVTLAQPFQGWAREGAKPVELFEEKIKAGLVYNFLKYTTWPAKTEKGNLRVCLFGADPLNGYLDPLAGKHAQQAVIDIVRVKRISESENCELIFIGSTEEGSLPELLSFLKDKQVLTVSDIEEFAEQGGMVELAKENQRITFYINARAVKIAGLDIGDRLLKLAKIIPG